MGPRPSRVILHQRPSWRSWSVPWGDGGLRSGVSSLGPSPAAPTRAMGPAAAVDFKIRTQMLERNFYRWERASKWSMQRTSTSCLVPEADEETSMRKDRLLSQHAGPSCSLPRHRLQPEPWVQFEEEKCACFGPSREQKHKCVCHSLQATTLTRIPRLIVYRWIQRTNTRSFHAGFSSAHLRKCKRCSLEKPLSFMIKPQHDHKCHLIKLRLLQAQIYSL